MNANRDTDVKSEAQFTEDVFKKTFKYYKANKPKPSLDEVISVGDDAFNDKVTPLFSPVTNDGRSILLGLKNAEQWKLYSFIDHPGLVLIQDPFTTAGQRYWIRRCLQDYPKKPNKTNIDIETYLQDWWLECHKNGAQNMSLKKKLRWTTLGYHHNWDTKVYTDDNKSVFPSDLAELSDVLATGLGYQNFRAQAAIVNYYHMNSTLSPHTDHSEVNLDAPLFSFSFGQSAIFLIGGQDKSKEPSAILLQSGDIIVMSKEARLCYHAVPKILPAKYAPWSEENSEFTPSESGHNLKYISDQNEIIKLHKQDEANWGEFEAYISESRINMNVRQVLNEKQDSISGNFIDR